MYMVGSIVTSFYTGSISKRTHLLWGVALGNLLNFIALVGFSLIEDCNAIQTYYISVILRLIIGIAQAFLCSSASTLLIRSVGNEKPYYLGLLTAFYSIAICTGPMIGALIYVDYGFKMTFLGFAAIVAVIAPFSLITLYYATKHVKDDETPNDKTDTSIH